MFSFEFDYYLIDEGRSSTAVPNPLLKKPFLYICFDVDDFPCSI